MNIVSFIFVSIAEKKVLILSNILKDYYKILEIERNSTEVEIKRAYRKLALKYHPDVNDAINASALFRDVNEAYRTLGNAVKKRHYDFYYASGSSVKLDDKYRQDKGRKYGTAYRNEASATKSRPRAQQSKKEEKADFTTMENWMFASLILIGLFAIFLAVRDLYNNEVEDLNAFSGIIFALLFTFLLVYSWTQIYRRK
jgi:curved DNA-binding protein CbpA